MTTVEIVTKNQISEMIDHKLNKTVLALYEEIAKLRIRLVDLERMVDKDDLHILPKAD